MKISLNNISKYFDSGWIIKDLGLLINSGDRLAIKGPNGSGKSTLIKIISAYLSPSKGTLTYEYDNRILKRDEMYKFLSIYTADSDLDEELTPVEMFSHFKRFKDYLIKDSNEFMDLVDLQKHKNKAVKFFSSGMKQRLNLALAICMDVPLLILDEPTSFLDADKKDWYNTMVDRFCSHKTIVVASNETVDFKFCNKELILNLP